jgi:hypothetical protein
MFPGVKFKNGTGSPFWGWWLSMCTPSGKQVTSWPYTFPKMCVICWTKVHGLFQGYWDVCFLKHVCNFRFWDQEAWEIQFPQWLCKAFGWRELHHGEHMKIINGWSSHRWLLAILQVCLMFDKSVPPIATVIHSRNLSLIHHPDQTYFWMDPFSIIFGVWSFWGHCCDVYLYTKKCITWKYGMTLKLYICSVSYVYELEKNIYTYIIYLYKLYMYVYADIW